MEQGLIPGVSDVELSADSRTLIATHPDHLGRPHKVGQQTPIITWAGHLKSLQASVVMRTGPISTTSP